MATDTSVKTRKVEGKLDALVNLLTQLVVNQKSASVRRWLSNPSSFGARNDAIVIGGVHDVATDTSAETRKVEGKLDALVNLVTQLARRWHPTTSSFGVRNDVILIREVHDVATNTSAETRKVEDKLDALVNLVTQQVVNQKPASVARVCGIRSFNDHHTNQATTAAEAIHLIRKRLPTPSSFGSRNDVIVIRGVHNVARDTYAETRKVEGKLDALVNLVTQQVVNRKPASVARVCCIRSSDDHHANVYPFS
ncbi:hypothetical protein Fmac_024866 [Flemingia macrophylla]|uniref:Uncharacterized protein n=1 Tax=Flemingia macrophylla TaxID=520843 RepID=A0ABD1LQP7_9FABA